MVTGGRQVVPPRLLAGELRGHRIGREVVDRRRVAVPGRVARQARDVREQLGVDLAVGVRERAQRQLVEHDVHDRRRGAGRRDRRADRLAGQEQAVDRRDDQEQEEDDQRRGGEHGEERAHARRARVQGGRSRPQGQCDRNGDPRARRARRPRAAARAPRRTEPPARASLPTRARGGSGPAPRRSRRRRAAARARSRARAPGGRRGAPARDEELGVAPEQVEQRLGECQRPQPAEMQRGKPETDRAAHARAG